MMIQRLFEFRIDILSAFIINIYIVMSVAAAIFIISSLVLLAKRDRRSKWLGLIGCLLLVNPLIYFFTN
ncbi:MAG: hypothetical protein RR554_07805 [Vagococcus sp.]|uniref:hypothetical protein n=1 Tax=Vagococcus sp. TaxID=1933889 RepID=UPI002FC5DA46